MSEFSSEVIIKWLLTAEIMPTRPTAWYVAMHTGDPGDDGSGNEVSTSTDDANYARQSVAFTSAVDGSGITYADNDADITFPDPATGADYTVTYVSLWDALTSGNMIDSMVLPAGRNVAEGVPAVIYAGELVITG